VFPDPRSGLFGNSCNPIFRLAKPPPPFPLGASLINQYADYLFVSSAFLAEWAGRRSSRTSREGHAESPHGVLRFAGIANPRGRNHPAGDDSIGIIASIMRERLRIPSGAPIKVSGELHRSGQRRCLVLRTNPANGIPGCNFREARLELFAWYTSKP